MDRWFSNGVDTYHITDNGFEVYDQEGPAFNCYTDKPNPKAALAQANALLADGFREV